MIEALTNEILDKIVSEIKKNKNQEKIKTYIVDPSISYCLDRLYPYLIITSIFFIIILLIAICTLFLMLKSYFNKPL